MIRKNVEMTGIYKDTSADKNIDCVITDNVYIICRFVRISPLGQMKI
jgi:hypothetical protein